MYERMLDKNHKPTNEEFLRHCGTAQGPFEELDRFLSVEMNAGKLLRFPYGNKYGW
ncbi:MAG: DUF3788 domain-containing protein [Bacilli bacterium]|jgi:hypothetical protein|nr:DUF3788 domain-containing protein [Bacilli bacterium]